MSTETRPELLRTDPVVVLFNRDLRVHDHPALATAVERGGTVVPLLVIDDAIIGSSFGAPNRVGFLVECLRDLQASLRKRGGDLVVRRGDPVREALRVAELVAARAIFASEDVGIHAQVRERRLAEECQRARVEHQTFPGVTVVPPDEVRSTSGGHYRVFTPYWRAWSAHPWRSPAPAPGRVLLPEGLDPGVIPDWHELVPGVRSPDVIGGGESEARRRFGRWKRDGLARYGDVRDDLAADDTSRIGAALHLGCLSPLEVANEARHLPEAEPFLRQLCWRDFHHQVTASHPRVSTVEYRSRGDRWRDGGDDLRAWQDGCTGYPIVDAGMRQLRAEGWMHNRARLVTASFLAKHLYVDWRAGARWFEQWLVDGDVANNSGNWQWVAGTGNDTRPNRLLNPLRQADRFDPSGDYVRRWVPELAHLEGPSIHRPWEAGLFGAPTDYPERLVDLDEAAAAFRSLRI